jgi:hypothetical protein
VNRADKDAAITALALVALVAILGVVFGFAVARMGSQPCELVRFEPMLAPGPVLVPFTRGCE